MKLSNMAAGLRKHGLTVYETPGWANRGYAGQDMSTLMGVLWHHTATGRSAFQYSDAPTLNLCVNGRSDLAGPLCHIVLGRSGTVYLTAAGVANHAGRGSAPGLANDSGNHHLIGIEMESSGIAPFDWTDDQKRVAPYLGAALALLYWGDKDHLQLSHSEYSSEGKIDPAGWPGGMDGLRASVNVKMAELQGKPATVPVGTVTPDKPKAPGLQAGKYVADPHWLVEQKNPAETMSQIAEWAGVSVAELAKFNGIANPNVIHVGERIWAPQGRFGVWTVDPGDTLSSISAWWKKHYNHTVTVDQICYANGINDVTRVPVGLRLVIP